MRFTQAEVDAYEERKRASEARRRAGLGLVTPFSALVREAQSPDSKRPICHAPLEPVQGETLYSAIADGSAIPTPSWASGFLTLHAMPALSAKMTPVPSRTQFLRSKSKPRKKKALKS